MIFTRTKRTAQKVADELVDRGFAAGAVHGDLGQGAREQALRAFRSGKVDVLVATDVAARGLDVEDVTHVINYQCPDDEMTYVHRIGRTARAGKSGTSVTLVDWDDLPKWKLICDTAEPAVPRAVRDLLHVGASLSGTRHSRRCQGRASATGPHPGRTGRRGRGRPRRSEEAGTASPRVARFRERSPSRSRGGQSGEGRSASRARSGASKSAGSGSARVDGAARAGSPEASRNRRRRRTRSGAAVAGAGPASAQSPPAAWPTARDAG